MSVPGINPDEIRAIIASRTKDGVVKCAPAPAFSERKPPNFRSVKKPEPIERPYEAPDDEKPRRPIEKGFDPERVYEWPHKRVNRQDEFDRFGWM